MHNPDLGTRLANDEPFAYNTLIRVFRYLSFKDLLNCAQVCPVWRWIINEDLIWQDIIVYCCAEHINKPANWYGSKIRRLELLNPARSIAEHGFQNLCSKMKNLQQLALHGCHSNQLSILAEKSCRLKKLYVEIYWGQSELSFMRKFVDLTHLDVVTYSYISDMSFLLELKKLKHLSLSALCEESVWDDIVKLGLESLSVDTDLKSSWISALFEAKLNIRRFKNLRKLQISNLPYFHEYDILDEIKLLPNIKELMLEYVSISRAGTSNFGSLLGQCHNIEKFTICINRVVFYDSLLDVALENSEIVNGVVALKNNLKYFCWILDNDGVTKAEHFYNQPNITVLKAKAKGGDIIPITLSKLQRTFQKKLPNTEVVLLDFETIKKIKQEKCCYECGKVIMTPQDRMKSYS